MQNKPTYIFLILCFLFSSAFVQAQSDKQKELEAKRQKLQQEIKQINSLLLTDKKKEKSVISTLENVNYKVSVLNNLIKITNDQANLLTREINNNQKEISNLRDQLTQLKDDYAAMVVKSYKSKSEQSKVMFLLSSDNFKQAYKRLQYMKQYKDHQKQQGEEIKQKTQKLQELNTSLLQQKKDKEQLVIDNRKAKKELEEELKAQETLIASIRKNLSNYTSQIKTKQQEVDKIDREIERLIKEAIAASNKKAGKSTNSKSFALTPKDKVLAKSFEANKGKLPWPVEKGVVKVRYGIQPHPIDKSLTFNSKGVRISTEQGSAIRAVFEGNVYAIIASKNGNPTVLIQHGNYFTAYSNLAKIKVAKGDKVSTNQVIGEVFTDSSNGESTLFFRVFKESDPQNPASWIYKM